MTQNDVVQLMTRDGEIVRVRPLASQDVRPLAGFYRALDEYTDRMFFVLSDFTERVVSDMLELQEQQAEKHLVVESPAGDIVGHVSLQPYPGVCPRLGICLLQGWQSRGLGRQLMEMTIDMVCALPDSAGIWLSVLEINDRARALYEDLGFRRVRQRVVKRRYSRYPANRGSFVLIDMVLSFPLSR